MQTMMNDPQNKSQVQVADAASEENAELRDLRKRLLDHIVRSRNLRQDRLTTPPTSSTHTQLT